MTRLSKLDRALDTLAEVFFDPVKSSGSDEVKNRHAYAQRQVLQGIAWKCNQQLDATVDARVDAARAQLTELAAKNDQTEIGQLEVARAANNFDFWENQQASYLACMEAASRCMARNGHGEYERTFIQPRTRTTAADAPVDDAKLAAILDRAGITPAERVTPARDGEGEVS